MTRDPAAVDVGFAGHVVRVSIDDDALRERVAATFRHMAVVGEPRTESRIILRRRGTAYVGAERDGTTSVRRTKRAAERWVRHRVIEELIEALPRFLWLHGAAAARDGRALLLPGQRGRGKSTLVLSLCSIGWTFLSDDVIPLDPATLEVHAFPRIPEARPDPGQEMPAEWLLEVEKSSHDIGARLASRPARVAAILLPHARRTGGTALHACSPAEAVTEIAAGCWNFAHHGVAGGAALARLVSAGPVTRLDFVRGDEAARVTDEWFSRSAAAR